MLTSEAIDKVSAALVKAQGELEHVAKDKNNPHFKSKYADLASVVDAIRPIYAKNGLAIVQGFVPSDGGVTIETRIVHTSGQWIGDEGLNLPVDKNTAQATGSAITYGRRYTLLAMSGVAPDDDDDGNAASAAPARKTQAKSENTARSGPNSSPAAARVTPEQAEELFAAALAAYPDKDEALLKSQAKNTLASNFTTALKKLKAAAANA